MQYLLALYGDETADDNKSEAEMGELFAAYDVYTEDLKAAGAMIAGEPLTSSADGARITTRDNSYHVQDGPFTDTKEQLGGFYLIEAANLDEALDWAARCPCAQTGTIEVRPVWNIGG